MTLKNERITVKKVLAVLFLHKAQVKLQWFLLGCILTFPIFLLPVIVIVIFPAFLFYMIFFPFVLLPIFVCSLFLDFCSTPFHQLIFPHQFFQRRQTHS